MLLLEQTARERFVVADRGPEVERSFGLIHVHHFPQHRQNRRELPAVQAAARLEELLAKVSAA